ncbi:MAG TPA: hypothetical protein VMZ53_10745 [Kofleriaceae bacterium]|nr:hypothetical protein [Kofleriaceae bacterium]
MSLRALLTAATTVIVAIALAVLVPVAQLQTFVEKDACCCPNPKACKCNHDDPAQPTMKTCHQKAPAIASTTLPSFVPPEVTDVVAPSRALIAINAPLPDPHPAPAPRRPDAPS